MRRAIGTTIVLAVAFGIGTPVQAGEAAPDEHCVVHVVGHRASGELVVTEPSCYSTLEEAMVSERVDASGVDAAQKVAGVATATFTIGTHYDGFNFTGSSMSVVGSDCTGGWLNVSAAWNNRISSTRHGCPHIRHYSGANLTGSSSSTFAPGANLTTFNNLTTSIRYLT